MADNTRGGSNDTALPLIATDDVSGVQYQWIKLDVGANGLADPVIGALPVSLIGTDVSSASSAAASPFGVNLPAVASKTNYLTGFQIGGVGATVAVHASANITGLLGGTRSYFFTVPVIGVDVVNLVVSFPRPIPASGTNVVIALAVPTFGVGNTLATASIDGFYR